MRKHILFIVENLPVPEDKRVWNEALAAKELGYKVSIISPKGKGYIRAIERIEDIDVYRHPLPIEANNRFAYIFEYIIALFWELLLSIKIFVKNPFHIIHAANPPDLGFIVALIYKIFGVKYIFDHHDISPELYLAKFGKNDTVFKILSIVEKMNFIAADIVISTNESYKKIAIERGRKSENQVFVVRNGPDLSRIVVRPVNMDLRDDFKYLVAYIGKIAKQESFDNILRIAKHVVNNKRIQNVKFIIIGGGPELDKAIELSKEMDLGKYIGFTGFVPYEKLLGILEQCDIGINPEYTTDYTNKSTMLKIMDYMLLGKPIIQFESKEGRVTAGEASLYIANNNEISFAKAIIDLLYDQDKRNKMGEIGKSRIYQSLHWDLQKLNLSKAYTSL